MIDQVLHWIGVAGASIAVVIGIWKASSKVLAGAHRWYHRVDQITAQLAPNGGTSLVDRVALIEQLAIEIRQADMLQGERFRIITNELGLAYWEADAAGAWIYVSTHLATLLYATPKNLRGTKWIVTVHQDDRNRVSREWNAAVRDSGRFNVSFLAVDSTGKHARAVLAAADPVCSADGAVQFWIGILTVEG